MSKFLQTNVLLRVRFLPHDLYFNFQIFIRAHRVSSLQSVFLQTNAHARNRCSSVQMTRYSSTQRTNARSLKDKLHDKMQISFRNTHFL